MELSCFRLVFYSEFIDFDDLFDNQYFLKDEQVDGDLGEKLTVAFEENFQDGFEKIVVIGSDCYDLSQTFSRMPLNVWKRMMWFWDLLLMVDTI